MYVNCDHASCYAMERAINGTYTDIDELRALQIEYAEFFGKKASSFWWPRDGVWYCSQRAFALLLFRESL